jgi:hypothetical protein
MNRFVLNPVGPLVQQVGCYACLSLFVVKGCNGRIMGESIIKGD